MPKYNYKARDNGGRLLIGSTSAVSEANVVKQLRANDLIPLDITLYKKSTWQNIKLLFSPKPSVQDMIILSGQLQSLAKSGVSIVEAINVTIDVCANKILRETLSELSKSVESGIVLSVALSKYSNIFPPLFIALVEVGENTGKLDESFSMIKKYLEKDLLTKRKIKSAVRYPLIVIIAVFFAVIIINVFVVPAFMGFFASFHAELPLATKILIFSSNLLTQHGLVILLGLLVIIIGLYFKFKTPSGRFFLSKMVLKIPWVGGFLEKSIFSRFCRCFGMVLCANVPIIKGLLIVRNVVNNPVLNLKVNELSRAVERGESLMQAARASKLFSPIVLQMLAVAERTGLLDVAFFEVADHYDMELDFEVKRMSEIIEPLLIIIISLMVLILALGVFLPMWDLSTVAFNEMGA